MNTTPTNTPSTDTRASAQASDTVQHLADTARHLTDSALQGAQSAIQATRSAADQSLDKAAHSVQGLRESAEPAIGDLAAKAQALASRSIGYCAQKHAVLRRQMDDCTAATTEYVKNQPGKSMAIAAATGAALTAAVLLQSRRQGSNT